MSFSIIIILFLSLLLSEDYEDVIYLKNGSIIYGTIIEIKPNEYYKMKSDKNIFIFKLEEIELIKKEILDKESNNKGKKLRRLKTPKTTEKIDIPKMKKITDCVYKDCNDDCNGNAIEDCNGDCNGNAKLDECGVCDGDGIADGACDCDGNVEDCAGVCGGDGKIYCGICTYSNDKRNCNDMKVLADILHFNPQLQAKDINDIGFVKWDSNGRLVSLKITKSNLKIIPESIGDLSKLYELNLDNNLINTLPPSICLLPQKTYISVSKNRLCDDYLFDCINYSRKQDTSNCP